MVSYEVKVEDMLSMLSSVIIAILAALTFACSGVVRRLYRMYVSPTPSDDSYASPIRIGLLGAAKIAEAVGGPRGQ